MANSYLYNKAKFLALTMNYMHFIPIWNSGVKITLYIYTLSTGWWIKFLKSLMVVIVLYFIAFVFKGYSNYSFLLHCFTTNGNLNKLEIEFSYQRHCGRQLAHQPNHQPNQPTVGTDGAGERIISCRHLSGNLSLSIVGTLIRFALVFLFFSLWKSYTAHRIQLKLWRVKS